MKKRFIAVIFLFCLLGGCKTNHTPDSSVNENTMSVAESTGNVSSQIEGEVSGAESAGNPEFKEIFNKRSEYFNQIRGFAFEDKQYWYCVDNADEGLQTLYKKSKKDDSITLLLKMPSIYPVGLSGGWIYYSTYNEDNKMFDLFRIDTDGKRQSCLLTADQFPERNFGLRQTFIVDNKVYIVILSGFYYYDINKKTLTDLEAPVIEYEIIGKYIYYCTNNFSIFRMDLHTQVVEMLLKGERGEQDKPKYKNLCFLDGEMYFYMRDPDGLYVYQNGNPKLITDDARIIDDSLFAQEHKLYCFKYIGDKRVLIEYDPSNETIREIPE